jgi:hypothetical protein
MNAIAYKDDKSVAHDPSRFQLATDQNHRVILWDNPQDAQRHAEELRKNQGPLLQELVHINGPMKVVDARAIQFDSTQRTASA